MKPKGIELVKAYPWFFFCLTCWEKDFELQEHWARRRARDHKKKFPNHEVRIGKNPRPRKKGIYANPEW